MAILHSLSEFISYVGFFSGTLLDLINPRIDLHNIHFRNIR